jgi:hypothetical protein
MYYNNSRFDFSCIVYKNNYFSEYSKSVCGEISEEIWTL